VTVRFILSVILWLSFSPPRVNAAIADSVHPDFEIAEIKLPALYKTMGLGFLSNGTMVLATTETIGMGEIPKEDPLHQIFLITGASTTALPKSMIEIANSWKQIAGITVVDDKIFVSDRDGFYAINSLLSPGDLSSNRSLIIKWPNEDHWNYGVSWHQWVFTPMYWKGSFYAPYSGSIRQGGWSSVDATSSLSGALLKWNLQGAMTAYAGGFRSPNGANLNPQTGEMFVTDNQGSWLPSSTFMRILPGHFYGHRQSSPDLDDSGRIVANHPPNFAESLPYDPPVAWLPHGTVRSSPSQPIMIPTGLYAGDWLIGDVNNPGLVRVALDRVGEAINGSVFWFTKGMGPAAINRMAWDPQGGLIIGTIAHIGGNWPAGEKGAIYRLWSKGAPSVFDMKAVRSLSDGVEIEFTQPVKTSSVSSTNFSVKQNQYLRVSEYGQGKQPDVPLSIEGWEISTDKRRVYLKMSGLKEDRVIEIQVIGVESAESRLLWNDAVWFTLNKRSSRNWNGQTANIKATIRIPDLSKVVKIRNTGSNGVVITLVGGGPAKIILTGLDGIRHHYEIASSGSLNMTQHGRASGVYVISVIRDHETITGQIVL
jgi:hypothetical protein